MTYPFLGRLRVIESSAFIAAPLAGLTLAQFGADVIRVDMIGGGIDYARMPRMPHPRGQGRSLYWTGSRNTCVPNNSYWYSTTVSMSSMRWHQLSRICCR